MFRQVVVSALCVGLTAELYNHEGLPHLPETIEVPSPLLTAPTIVASGSIATPYVLPSGYPWGCM